MSHLGVNIDHVATLRQARGTAFPDPVQAAFLAEEAGADLITVHLREDRRHITDRDVELLRRTVATRLNLEMAVTEEMLGIAESLAPHEACLVPERREEVTTEGGLDIASQPERIGEAVKRLSDAGVRVSLFIDPDLTQVATASRVGAPCVELHTGAFADAAEPTAAAEELRRIEQALARGRELGLQVNAGHGLNYQNVQPIARLPGIAELNIGHAIVARAVFVGLKEAVAHMKAIMQSA